MGSKNACIYADVAMNSIDVIVKCERRNKNLYFGHVSVTVFISLGLMVKSF